MNTKFRKLKASEIDARVSTVSEKGCSLLLYKDARVDQNILDETFGIFGWKRHHELIGDRLYCTVSIYAKSFFHRPKAQTNDSRYNLFPR